MTFEEVEQAILDQKKIYAVDYMGVDTIDFSSDYISYSLSNDTLDIMLNVLLIDAYALDDLYDNYEDAKKAFEELGL